MTLWSWSPLCVFAFMRKATFILNHFIVKGSFFCRGCDNMCCLSSGLVMLICCATQCTLKELGNFCVMLLNKPTFLVEVALEEERS